MDIRKDWALIILIYHSRVMQDESMMTTLFKMSIINTDC